MTTTEVPAPPQAISAADHSELLHRGAFDELRAAGYDYCPDCYTLRTGGVCPWCRGTAILNADPDWSAMSDAQARLDFGPFVSFEATRADEQIVAAFERKVARAERDARTEPNGCRHCGVAQRGHGQRRSPKIGRHVYVQPTDEQRLARMYARRATRLGLPVWQRPGAGPRMCAVCGRSSDAVECTACVIAEETVAKRRADR